MSGAPTTSATTTLALGEARALALKQINDAHISALCVTDDADAPLGLIRIHDCLRAGIA